MKTSSQVGINLVKFFEGLHDGDLSIIGLQPKMCPAGIWTEGYGRTMRDGKGKFIKGIANKKLAYSRITIRTVAQAEKALIDDLKTFERIVTRKIGLVLNQNQFDAIVSHTYNTGGSNTLFSLINKKADSHLIKNWIEGKYISANGVRLQGLVNRRKAESKLYFLKQ